MNHSNVRILRLNKSGLPRAWVSFEEAATLYFKDQVVWSLGDTAFLMHGGINHQGIQSQISLAPIIACQGSMEKHSFTAVLDNRLLCRRDEFACMYCGLEFAENDLTRDHIVPRVQGGNDHWKNVVAACTRCNHRKGGKTPEQAGMQLLAIPFEPNVFEFMYLANRQILGDQISYLKARFSGRRCWGAA